MSSNWAQRGHHADGGSDSSGDTPSSSRQPSRKSQLSRVASSATWNLLHLGIMASVLLILGGLAGLSQVADGALARALARLSVVAALPDAGVMLAGIAIDGFATNGLADLWASAAGADKAAEHRLAITHRCLAWLAGPRILSYISDVSEMTSMTGKWIAAVAIGGLAFGVLACLNAPMALLGLGVWFGVPQSVVLRRYVRGAWRWAVVTAAGMLGAWIVGVLTVLIMAALAQTMWQATAPPQVASLAFGVTAYLVAILLGGAAVGLAQSPLLPDAGRWRRRWVASTSLGALAFWVILAGGLVVLGGGWTATNALVGSALQVSTMPLLVAGGTLGGLAYGLTTAPTLGRIDPERTTRDALRPLPTTSPYG